MKQPPMLLKDRLELAARACRAAGLLSCEETCREAAKLLQSANAPTAELGLSLLAADLENITSEDLRLAPAFVLATLKRAAATLRRADSTPRHE